MTINFRKGVDSSLDGVTKLVFGAAWDRKTAKQSGFARKLALKTGGKINLGGGQKDIDLDLALILYRDGEPKRIVIGHNMDPVHGAAVHSGDNQTGEGDGDDETITLNLTSLPAWVSEWAVAVFAYKLGTNFDQAQNVSLNVYDASNQGSAVLLDELMPTLGAGATANIIASGKINRDAAGNLIDGWTATLVDKAGRLGSQGDDTAVLAFAKQNAGI
ncbi:TerD family protein [Streptomyces sp. NBC_01304]|uniref:TerD family protein n=1 Tax=Streptomyces sp. NBC_01304 TaxID=2903818 RepID=UPI002E114BCC|nr:TerD family protein [Streptomyces sp. NBC_01304]